MRTLSTLAVSGLLAVSANSGQSLPSGTLAGQRFTARAVELRDLGTNHVKVDGKVVDRAQAYILAFKGADEFMPDEAIEVWFSTDVGKKLEGSKIVCKSVKFGTDPYRAQHYKPTGGGSVARGVTGVFWNRPGVSDHVSDEIAATLQFGAKKGGWIAGSIDLQLPAKAKTRLRGSFKAKIGTKPLSGPTSAPVP